MSQFLGIPVVGYSFRMPGGECVKSLPVCWLGCEGPVRYFSDVRGAGNDAASSNGVRYAAITGVTSGSGAGGGRCGGRFDLAAAGGAGMGNTGPGAARSGRCAAGGDVHSFLGVADDRGRLAHRFHRGHAYLAAGHVAGGAAGTGGADPGLDGVPGRFPVRQGCGAGGLRPAVRGGDHVVVDPAAGGGPGASHRVAVRQSRRPRWIRGGCRSRGGEVPSVGVTRPFRPGRVRPAWGRPEHPVALFRHVR